MTEIQKYADAAMFQSEPMETGEIGMVVPRVHLLWMTPDPLGAAAAMNMMYRGIVVRNIAKDVPDDERRKVLSDMEKTRLTAPLEAIKLHFMIEGVTRSFTHQMVRQRTAVYAQESMRFAVVDQDDWTERCAIPPSINRPYREGIWADAINTVQEAYRMLIDDGVPAEDARGLMPHAMTTRLNYATDLRNLIEHAGNRLCTQAQFEWRMVFLGIIEAIAHYHTGLPDYTMEGPSDSDMRWQFEAIANSWMFRPVCYHTGKCEFMASADRFCSIRSRVESFHEMGVKPESWDARDASPVTLGVRKGVPGIFPAEWLVDPTAAREQSSGGAH